MPSREDGVSLDALREVVRLRVADTSLRQAARETGVSHQALAAFLNGSEPYGKNLAKIREWYGRETNELLRLRQEVTALRKRVAKLERELRRN
jgi:transcriptional regulator with XRE-family HTH domain